MTTSRDRFTQNEQRGHQPAPVAPTAEIALITKQLVALEAKVNQILELIKVSEKLATTVSAEVVEAEVAAPKKVVKKVATKVAAKKAPAKKVVTKKVAAKKVTKKK